MRKPLIVAVLAAAVAMSSLAGSYWVVLKDGTHYEAKTKWTIANGKAVLNLTNGTILTLDPNSIDPVKSEEMTRLGGGSLFGVEQLPATSTTKASQLGSSIRLRKLPSAQPGITPASTTADAPVIAAGPLLGPEVLGKFERAYENVGIFEHKIIATGAHSLRADVTADTEDKVFNILSATAFLIVRNAGVSGVQIESADLFMKTTTGAAAGRFHLTHDEAQALESKALTPQSYFVQKVLF